jgi:histone H2A
MSVEQVQVMTDPVEEQEAVESYNKKKKSGKSKNKKKVLVQEEEEETPLDESGKDEQPPVAEKTIMKFKKIGKKTTTRSKRAGLTFPVGRTDRLLRSKKVAKRVGATGSVYITAVLEYMAAELIDLAGTRTEPSKHTYTTVSVKGDEVHHKKRINDRDLTMAIHNDEEIHQLFAGVDIIGVGIGCSIAPEAAQLADSEVRLKRDYKRASKEEDAERKGERKAAREEKKEKKENGKERIKKRKSDKKEKKHGGKKSKK